MLRKLLSTYSKQSPKKLVFSYNSHGKPALANNLSPQIEFNVSHSRNKIAFAFAKNTPIGLDIEFKTKKKYFDKIAHRFFSKQDYDDVKKFSGEKKINIFFDRWVKNEALLKALGYRLTTHPLSSYAIEKKKEYLISDYNTCTVISFNLDIQLAAALAIKGKQKQLIIKNCDSI